MYEKLLSVFITIKSYYQLYMSMLFHTHVLNVTGAVLIINYVDTMYFWYEIKFWMPPFLNGKIYYYRRDRNYNHCLLLDHNIYNHIKLVNMNTWYLWFKPNDLRMTIESRCPSLTFNYKFFYYIEKLLMGWI